MEFNFKNVNITLKEDWKELEEAWNDHFDNDEDFLPIKQCLSDLNIIVGFGRGFWSGIDGYYYLTYHKLLEKYFWYVRDNESDSDVYFYEIDEEAPIFQLLRTLPIEKNFQAYDVELDFPTLYWLSKGNTDHLPPNMHEVSLEDVFGMDNEQLRAALMYFYPGSYGSYYPHLLFHQQYFFPYLQKKLDKFVEENNHSLKLFRRNAQLFIKIKGEEYKLTKVK